MSDSHTEKLRESIKRHGFLPSKPITVIEGTGGKFIVIDGHHRLEAAQQEEVEVYYVVEQSDASGAMADINVAVKKWGSAALVRLYEAKGIESYKVLTSYVDRGIPLQQASSLLWGHCASSCNAGKAVRAGTFKIKTLRLANDVVNMIEQAGGVCPVVKKKAFIDAFSALLFVPEFDPQLLLKRMLTNPKAMYNCSTRDQMFTVIEDVYNFRAHEKIPLKHLAMLKLRERQLDAMSPSKRVA